jgi:hypothetical protein
MITDIFLYLLSLVLTLMFTISDAISSGWTVWPASLTIGITYLFQQLMVFNFIFPVDTLLQVIVFVMNFEVMYFSVKILLKLFNWIRGASGIEI